MDKVKVQFDKDVLNSLLKLKEVGEHLKAAGSLAGRINDILGQSGEIGSGIDSSKWEQIKPLLHEMYDHIIAAGQSAKEFVALLVKSGFKATPFSLPLIHLNILPHPKLLFIN